MNMHVGGAEAQRVTNIRFKAGDKVVANQNEWGVEEGKEYTVSGYANPTSIGPWVYLAEISNRVSIDGSFQESSFSPATLTIREGGYYRTRDGRKVGPMRKWWPTDVEHPWEDGKETGIWRDDGTSRWDEGIVAEWQDEPLSAYPDIAVAQRESEELLDWLSGDATPAIVARIDNGQPLPARKPYVHASVADASKEATRLAKANPGREFAVYEMVHTVSEQPQHEWQRLALKPSKADAIAVLKRLSGITTAQAKRIVYDYAA